MACNDSLQAIFSCVKPWFMPLFLFIACGIELDAMKLN